MSLTFSPTTAGAKSASAVVTSDATGSPQSVALAGSGVTPTKTLTLSPTSLDYGTQNTGTTSGAQGFTVTNTGNTAVAISSVALGGANANQFAIASNNCPSSLNAGAACSVSLTFSPTTAGAKSASAVVTSDATGSPQSVALAGSGVTPTKTLTLSPTSLDYGTQNTGTTSGAQGFTVTNTGNTAVAISSIALGGANANQFAIASNNCPSSLNAGTACSVSLTFSPTTAGAKAASAVVTSDATGSPQSVALSGSGQTPTFTLSFNPAQAAFGTQNTNETSTPISVTLSNNGNSPITFSNFALSGANAGDFAIQTNNCPLSPSTLPVSGNCQVALTFTPSANGARSASLVVTSNASGSPHTVAVSGTGQTITRLLTVTPGSLTFQAQNQGSTSNPQQLVLQNTGSGSLTLNSISLAGTHASDFSIFLNNCPGSSSTLAPGNSCVVQVNFTPSAVGARAATLTIASNATSSPHTVTITGTGQAVTRELTFTPASLTFATTNTGSNSTAQGVTLQNTGTAAVTISSMTVGGAHAGDYSITSNNCPLAPATLAAAGACSFQVVFSPTAAGTRTASVVVVSDATGSPHSVALTGTGQVQNLTLTSSPASLTFAAQNLSTTSSNQSISLQNTGNGSITISGFSLTGTHASDFSIAQNTCPSGSNQLAAGANCTIQINFTPAAVGARTASLSIASNATGSPLVVGLSGTGQSSNKTLSFSPASRVFGNVTVGNTSTAQSFTITANGNSPVVLSGISIGGANASDFSIASNSCPVSPAQLSASTSCSLTVIFAPTAAGARAANVVVNSDASGSPHNLALTGMGQGPATTLSFSPATLTFPLQNVGTLSQQRLVYIQNTGTSPALYNAFTLTGPHAGDYAITFNNCPQPPSSDNPGASCQVGISFTPTAPGTRTAALVVSSNATGTPHTIPISGEARANTTALTEYSSNLPFPAQTVGTTSSQRYIQLRNTGTTPLSISGVTLGGTHASDFQISLQQCPIAPVPLTEGAVCTVYLTFTPSGAGSRTASLTVASDASGSPQSFAITGTGQAETKTITFSTISIAFGSYPVGQPSGFVGTYILNTGTAAVTLGTITVGGSHASDFTLSTPNAATCQPGESLPPNNGCWVYLTFTPSATGSRSATLTVTSDATPSPQVITLSGTGTAASQLTAQPTTVTFAPQNQGSASALQNVTIYNSGSTAVNLTGITLGGTAAGDYAIAANTCGASLPAGANCAVSLRFTPTATGARSASLQITHSAGSPINIAINGTGQSANQTMQVSPTSLSFTAQNVSTTSNQQYIEIRNIGSGNLTLGGVSVSGTNASDFAISQNTCPAAPGQLTPNQACYVYFTFTPGGIGTRTATAQVTSNAANSPVAVTLSGIGRAAVQTLQMQPSALTFSPQVVNTVSSAQAVYVSNDGTAPFAVSSVVIAGANAGDFGVYQNNCSTVTPGSGCYIYVQFEPTASGMRNASLVITSNAPGSPHSVPLSGIGRTGTQTLTLSSNGLTFAPQTLNTTSAGQYFYVTNVGTVPVLLNSFTLGGSHAGDFSVQQNQCLQAPQALAPNGSCYVYLQFTPTAIGERTATFTIGNNSADGPVTVSLRGTGAAATQLISVSDTGINFPARNVGTTSPTNSYYFYVTNTGSAPVTLTSFNIVGANSGDFAIQGNTCPAAPAALAANSNCYLYVSFTPSAVGPRSARVEIASSASTSPDSVALTGTGVALTKAIDLQPSGINFPATNVGATTPANSHYFYVANDGTQNLALTGFTLGGANPGDFSIGQNTCPASLTPNSTCYLYVNFAPTATGARSATITVANDGVGQNVVTLTGIGQSAVRTLAFQPSPNVFEPRAVGSTSGQQYTYIQNTGTAPVTISAISLTGAHAGDFAITSQSCPVAPAVLGVNGACYVYTTFKPSAAGDRTAALSITSNAAGSPQTVQLLGRGSGSGGILTISNTQLDYAPQNTGTASGAQAVYISNSGGAALSLTGITIGGTNAGDFAQSFNNCGSTLNAGASCQVNITFTPTAVGDRTATLNIANSTAVNPVTVALSGTGRELTVPALTVSQSSLTFGSQNTGTTSGAQGVNIYNYGTGSVSLSGISITGANASDFGVSFNNCGSTLAGFGAACTVNITFTPTNIGPRSASLQIASSAPASPQTVSLFGTGQAPSQSLVTSQSMLSFPFTNVEATSTARGVTVYNLGTAPMSLTGFTLTGTNAGEFQITFNNCGSVLAAGGACSLNLVFRPSAIGVRSAQLRIDNSAPGNPHYVDLVGTGRDATTHVVLTDTALAFNLTNIDTPSTAQSLQVRNLGTAPVSVNSISIGGANASDYSISFNNCGSSIAAEGACTISVVFQPAASGDRTASLNISTNDSGSPHTVLLTGSGRPVTRSLTFSLSSVTFPPQNVSTQSAVMNISVYNYATAPVTFSGVAIGGANAGDFAISANNCPSTLTVNGGCTISIRFTPTATGARSAALVVSSDGAGSPQSISLFGTGQSATQILQLGSSAMNFGTQAVGASSSQVYLELRNTGTATMNLTGFTLGGSNASEFAITQNACGSTLNSGTACYVYLRFTPGAAGPRSASLQIANSSPTNPAVVGLFGNGQ